MTDDFNPYAAPEADLTAAAPVEDDPFRIAEAIRRANISHEAAICSIGSLSYIFGIIAAFLLLILILDVLQGNGETIKFIILASVVPITATGLALGWGLSSLKPWARRTTIACVTFLMVAAIIGLLAGVIAGLFNLLGIMVLTCFTFGTLSYILYLLRSKNGGFIFSAEYAEVIRVTPHVQYESSCLAKITIGVLAILIALGVSFAIVFRH